MEKQSPKKKVVKKYDNEMLEFFDTLCAKPKKQCSFCDRTLKPTKEDMATAPKVGNGRLFCSYVSFKHPKYKSKSYKVCGGCYASVLRKGK